MMKVKSGIVLFLIGLAFGCKDRSVHVADTPRDTTITAANAVSELFLDSLRLETFIASRSLNDSTAQLLRNFYNSRNYQFAWFTNEGLAEQALAFWNLHDNYLVQSRDSSMLDSQLHDRMKRYIDGDTLENPGAAEIIQTELQLTEHFFQYAQFAYAGKVDPAELQWHIPRKKVDAMALLDSLIVNKGQNIEAWEPVNPQYRLMKMQLQHYDEVDKGDTIPEMALSTGRTYKTGDSSSIIIRVKERLQTLGDYTARDTSPRFTPELMIAVKQAQKRFGHQQDGIINTTLIAALNVPVKERIEQMLINMERMRWMPKEPQGNRIVVNIPEFKLHVFERSKKVLDFDIVVGTSVNRTVIFNNMLKYVVFSPYWNIPESIVRNEILPAMRRSSGYLARMNMEQTGFANGLPVIRQKPGGSNALGRVKFIFPNSFNIYFHDTPSKSLFKQNNRAFSHGCIRVDRPEKLAEYLLRDRPEWPADSIRMAMQASREKWVTLKEPLPVIITYLTCWVSNDGLLNFRQDIYGHDAKMAERLFAHQKNVKTSAQ